MRKKIEELSGSIMTLLITALFIALLYYRDLITESVRSGLAMCFTLIVPALFPFMVLSRLIVSYALSTRVGRILDIPSRLLLGLPGEALLVFLLGCISGFPVGAQCSAQLYESGICTKNEAERLVGFTNNASAAFVLSVVGGGIFGDVRTGVVLFVIQTTSALICGMLSRFFMADTGKPEEKKTAAVKRLTLSASITDCMGIMLTVCGSILFYSAIISLADNTARLLSLGEGFTVILGGLLEISNGMAMLARQSPNAGFLLACLFLGWSGISVHTQIAAVVSKSGLSQRPYYIMKTAQSVLCLLFGWIYISFFGGEVSCISYLQRGHISGVGINSYFTVLVLGSALVGVITLPVVLLRKKYR